jgi:hypothetical protein
VARLGAAQGNPSLGRISLLWRGPAGRVDAERNCCGTAQLQMRPEPIRDAGKAKTRPSCGGDWGTAGKRSRPGAATGKRSRPGADARKRSRSGAAGKWSRPRHGRRWPSRDACWLHRPGRPKSARYQLMLARRGRNSPMSAHKREYRPGKNIFRLGKLYAGPGNAEVNPGPTYADWDINRDFYFRSLGSLVVLSFPQPLNFFSVFPFL